MQDCSIFIASALDILQSCTKPSMWLLMLALISDKLLYKTGVLEISGHPSPITIFHQESIWSTQQFIRSKIGKLGIEPLQGSIKLRSWHIPVLVAWQTAVLGIIKEPDPGTNSWMADINCIVGSWGLSVSYLYYWGILPIKRLPFGIFFFKMVLRSQVC